MESRANLEATNHLGRVCSGSVSLVSDTLLASACVDRSAALFGRVSGLPRSDALLGPRFCNTHKHYSVVNWLPPSSVQPSVVLYRAWTCSSWSGRIFRALGTHGDAHYRDWRSSPLGRSCFKLARSQSYQNQKLKD